MRFSQTCRVFFAICLLGFQSLWAQTAVLRGYVMDEAQNPLKGASIRLLNTPKGTTTDAEGYYQMGEMRPGAYTVQVSFVGYVPQDKKVILQVEEVLSLDFIMVLASKDQVAETSFSDVVITAERPFSTASAKEIRQFDMQVRPVRTAQDLLQLVPGLIIAQHAGGGKAEQIYLRNFDADHGTDVAIFSDGMPVNMVSHGHGQGYADLHFMIPETIAGLEVAKGPYFAPFGNLATAGAVSFQTKDELEQNEVKVEGGMFDTYKVTALIQPFANAQQSGYWAGQYAFTNGPTVAPQNFHRYNFFGKYHYHLRTSAKWTVSASAFGANWNQSGQVPDRAVKLGLISRFGSLDPTEGGKTQRQNLNIRYQKRQGTTSETLLQAWASRYQFQLFSNFTYFLEDYINGDMIEQTDDRLLGGLNARQVWYHASQATTSLGVNLRYDQARVSLWKSPARMRLTNFVDAEVMETNGAVWAEHQFKFGTGWELQAGLRADAFNFDVQNHAQTPQLPRANGNVWQFIASPKLNLAYRPYQKWEYYANAGLGFHSNDARNVIIGKYVQTQAATLRAEGKTPLEIAEILQAQAFDVTQEEVSTLPRAFGAELGLRFKPVVKTSIGVALWRLDLEREFVYVGDGGFTELSDPTLRFGLDLEARTMLSPRLAVDLDLTLSKGRVRGLPDDENYIPLAPHFTMTGGLKYQVQAWTVSLRGRHIGDRPANEDNSVVAAGHTLFNLGAAFRMKRLALMVQLENIGNVEWNEAQFDTESRLQTEPAPVSELHYTPGNPRNLQVGLSYMF